MKYRKSWIGHAHIYVTLDGFVAGTDDNIDWIDGAPQRQHADVDSSHQAQSWITLLPRLDHVVIGRRTYELADACEEWPYGEAKVIVLSRVYFIKDERVTVVRTPTDARRLLAEGDAEQVLVDGANVIQLFLQEGLIDKLTTVRCPILIGEGVPFVGPLGSDVHLTLMATHADDDGRVHTTYRVGDLSQQR